MTHRSQDPFDDVPDLRRDRPVGGGEGSFRRQPVPAVYRRRRWATVGVLVVVLVTLVVLVRAVAGGTGDAGNSGDSAATPDNDAAAMASVTGTGEATPGPIPGVPTSDDVGSLPPGGKVTDKGRGTWRGVGSAGAVAGDPHGADTRTLTYVVETEQGIDTASFGGGDSFAAMVDATLADPRSWIGNRDDLIAFRHISVSSSDTPDLRIRLTSPETTRQLCGGEIELETSCFVSGGDSSVTTDGAAGDGRVIINLARWARGALPFAGDLGSYRQYVLNHEIGHGIGHAAHQPCQEDGALAPIMMQQTLSLANKDLIELDAGTEYMDDDRDSRDAVCRANAWPHPEGD
ncbi:DUF3152 domain-containing protein [Corynebacterium variabile]|uniref:DUF3152 domain-containing protein n=1 Tax=Corynebacterium variabile TaxID=1727 RepID=UPI0028ADC834|nr:DUF3152 domain-containing protein [Corynebacterium variabile]